MKTKVTGHSMYPFLIEGRDIAHLEEVDITPTEPLKPESEPKAGVDATPKSALNQRFRPGDVLLYRRDTGILVLHRVVKVTSEGYYMLGDSQQKSQIEGPIRPEQIKGILTARERDGKILYTTNPLYRLSAFIWRILLPLRRPLQKVAFFFRHCLSDRHPPDA